MNTSHVVACCGGDEPGVTIYDQMRSAADVMDAVNARYSSEHPIAGNSGNEPISASSMRFLADLWEGDRPAVLVVKRYQEGQG